jgi:hypothetical protein
MRSGSAYIVVPVRAICLGAILILSTVKPANAAVIWTFGGLDPQNTPVSGFFTFGNFTSGAPGTLWTSADLTDYSITYNGEQIASFANPGCCYGFFGPEQFTATAPFDASSFNLMYSINTFDPITFLPYRNFAIAGDSNQTSLFCFSGVTPNQPVCNGATQNLVPLVWNVNTTQGPGTPVPEPGTLTLVITGLFAVRHRRAALSSVRP